MRESFRSAPWKAFGQKRPHLHLRKWPLGNKFAAGLRKSGQIHSAQSRPVRAVGVQITVHNRLNRATKGCGISGRHHKYRSAHRNQTHHLPTLDQCRQLFCRKVFDTGPQSKVRRGRGLRLQTG